MTDIAALISWLRVRQECESRVANAVSGAGEAAERYGQCAAALSRLTAPPPDEIAGLISWCEVNRDRDARLATTVSGAGEGAEIYAKLADALRALERTRAESSHYLKEYSGALQRLEALAQEIERLSLIRPEIIERKTIEKCAKLFGYPVDFVERALAHSGPFEKTSPRQ